MAEGRSIGTVFVELDLDASRYLKGQQQLYKDATTTSLSIEQNFKNLGIKTSAEFDLMRQKIRNSYTSILNDHKATANDILRAEEAKNAKLRALNEQQFGQQKTGLEILKANWIAATVAIASAMALVNKAMAYINQGAMALQAEESFKRVAESAEESADRIVIAMKRATAGTVDDSELRQRAVKGMMLGLSGDAMIKIAEMARLGARVAGVSVAEAITGITNSISTMMPRALKQYGLALGPEVALITKAQREGIEGIDLMALATINYNIQLARQGELHDNAAEKIQMFKARMKETAETIGKEMIGFLVRWTEHWDNLGRGIKDATERLSTWITTALGLKGVKGVDPSKWTAEETAAFGGYGTGGMPEPAAAPVTSAASERIKELEAEKKAFLQHIKDLLAAKKNVNKVEKEILQASLKEHKALYDQTAEMAQHDVQMAVIGGGKKLDYELNYIQIVQTARYKQYSDDWDAIEKTVQIQVIKNEKLRALHAEYMKDRQKLSNEAKKTELEQVKDSISEQIKDWELMAKIKAATLKQDIELQKMLYDELTKQEGTSPIDQLNKEMEFKRQGLLVERELLETRRDNVANIFDSVEKEREMKDILASILLIDKEIMNVEIERATKLEGMTALAGWSKGWRSALDQASSMFNQMESVGRDTARAMATFFSDSFFDIITGKAKTFGEYFRSFLTSIARSLSNVLATEIANGILRGMSGGSGGASGAAGWVMGMINRYVPIGSFTGGGGGGEGVDTEGTGIVGHTGGMVDELKSYRFVSSSAFHDAPRFHSGVGPGERAAILRNDEGVFTPGQMRALGSKMDSGGVTYNITNNINAVDAKSFYELCRQNPNAITDVSTQSLQDNKTRSRWKSLLS